MKKSRYTFIFNLIFFLFTLAVLGRSVNTVNALAPAWSPLIITSPTSLSPMPDEIDPLCRTYWYTIDTPDGYPAYLTLNVTNQSGSTNSGEWRPNIPTTGYYKIEVYIPSHGQINWNCGPGKLVDFDTTNATYTISTLGGTKEVKVNQTANSGKWVSLGNYRLTSGINNALSLTDITGEQDYVSLVSFSMARFTWISSSYSVFLPQIFNKYDQASLTKVRINSVFPYAREGSIRYRFDLDEPVTYRISGTNGYTSPESVRLAWQYSGPCGYFPESEISLVLPVGNWSYDLGTTTAPCRGQNTAYIRIYSRGALLYQALPISVDGGATMQLFQGAAFDMCHLPTVSTMQSWWNSSPYSVINIYMGGISFASGCNYSGLSRDWVKNVQNIGWGYIPTWVGPQAPCSDLQYRFSFDTTAAYNQGVEEAQLAFAKATQLGLVSATNNDTILYYDMEGYSYANNAKDSTVRAACRTAVKSFLKGWTEQLHVYGMQAGGYGGTSSSYISDWWSIVPVLDSIWAAQWKTDQYDPQMGVYDISLNTSYWNPNKRVRQYAGDHYETWGGKQLAIDSDVADSSLLMPRFRVTKPAMAADPSFKVSAHVVDFQLLTPKQGWLIDQGTLHWTEDSGQTWTTINVPLAAGDGLEKGFFLNSAEGWLLVMNSSGGYTILSTKNGGESWESQSLPDYGPVASLDLNFIDSLNGTLKFRFQTSQAFREGYILTTIDGGVSWHQGDLAQDDLAWDQALPAGAPAPEGALQVRWVSSSEAWARVFHGACSGGGDQSGYICLTATELMATSDGGQTWTEIYP